MRPLVKERQSVIAVMQDESRKACEKLKRQILRDVGHLRQEAE